MLLLLISLTSNLPLWFLIIKIRIVPSESMKFKVDLQPVIVKSLDQINGDTSDTYIV